MNSVSCLDCPMVKTLCSTLCNLDIMFILWDLLTLTLIILLKRHLREIIILTKSVAFVAFC